MQKFWDTLGIVFALAAVFLLLYYWRGAVEVARAVTGGITDVVMSTTGGLKPGWTRSAPVNQ